MDDSADQALLLACGLPCPLLLCRQEVEGERSGAGLLSCSEGVSRGELCRDDWAAGWFPAPTPSSICPSSSLVEPLLAGLSGVLTGRNVSGGRES